MPWHTRGPSGISWPARQTTAGFSHKHLPSNLANTVILLGIAVEFGKQCNSWHCLPSPWETTLVTGGSIPKNCVVVQQQGKQDKVNNANSAFFLINHLISWGCQSGSIGQVCPGGSGGRSGQGGLGGSGGPGGQGSQGSQGGQGD